MVAAIDVALGVARLRRGAWIGFGLLLALGCASADLPVDPAYRGGYASDRLGFRVAHPGGPDAAGWRSIEVEGADYAVRAPAGEIYSLGARCRETAASAQALARHLLIGTPQGRVVEAGPVEASQLPGYRQRIRVGDAEAPDALWMDAVTLKRDRCVFDLIVIARDAAALEHAEPTFDRWCRTFGPVPGREAGPDGSGEGTS